MVHALAHRIRDPADLVTAVNTCVANHPIDEIFTLNLLICSPRLNELRYLSCGYGPLWVVRAGTTHADVIHSDNIAIGIDPAHLFLTVARSWHVGDSIFLSTFHPVAGDGGRTEEDFTQAVEELIYTSPQKQADGLLRRLVHTEATKLRQRPATIITIQRTA